MSLPDRAPAISDGRARCYMKTSSRHMAEEQPPQTASGAPDGMPQPLAILNTAGILLECNRAALEAAGLSRGDAIGKPLWEAFGREGTAKSAADLRAAVRRAAEGELAVCRVEVHGSPPSDSAAVMDFTIGPVK